MPTVAANPGLRAGGSYMQRRVYRGLSLVFALGGGAFLTYGGLVQGWVIKGWFPVQYLGYLLIGLTLLGVCGFNIWAGGPLDPRDDQASDSTKEADGGGE